MPSWDFALRGHWSVGYPKLSVQKGGNEEPSSLDPNLLSIGWKGSGVEDELELDMSDVELISRTWTTWFLAKFSLLADRKAKLWKVRKMKVEVRERRMAASHTHPDAARIRATGTEFVSDVCKVLGTKRYDFSVSPREERLGARGERQYRTTKDLLVEPKVGVLRRGDLVSMVDNCYYVDEKTISQFAGHDLAFFCLQPEGLAGKGPNSSWAFEDPETVVEEVQGGAVYRHKVWDWRKDVMVFGKGWRTYLYDVVPFRIAEDRYVVVLLVANTISLPMWLAKWLIPDMESHRLKRMQVEKQGEYLLGSFGTATEQRIQLRHAARVGNTSVVMKPDTFCALSIAAKIPNTDKKVPKTELLPAEACRVMKHMGETMAGHEGHVLSDYFTHHYLPSQLVNYQAVAGMAWEEGKTTAAMAAVPLVGHGAAPTSSSNNEARAIEKRVVEIANSKTFDSDMVRYGEEFAVHIVPVAHKGVPWDMEELRAKQNRPAQVTRRLQEERHVPTEGRLRTQSFQKNEVYAKVGDPRIINQVPTCHTNDLCAFSGAIKEHLKKGPAKRMYMVGKNPAAIGRALQGLHKSQGKLAGGDYSRMDGRTSVCCRRYVLKPVYMRYFGEEYHSRLSELLDKEERASTKTKRFGHKAVLRGANISGSGVTTDLNTLDAAFMEYVARRRGGEGPEEAFRHLGCYFGDDSLVAEGVFEQVRKVADGAGMVLTKEEEPEGALPGRAVFLSRVYVDLSSTIASHPDTHRALRKLCMVSCGPAETKSQRVARLALKVEGILAADPQVPVLADYARALERVYELKSASVARDVRGLRDTAGAKSLAYKVRTGPYPLRADDIPLLEESIARDLGFGVAEMRLLIARLQAAVTEEDLVACARSVSSGDATPALPEWAKWVPIDG